MAPHSLGILPAIDDVEGTGALRILIDVIKAGDERSIAAARQAAEKILEEIGEKVD